MAATAAITRNPACSATSSSSTSVSSNARFPYTQTKTARAPLPRTMPNRSATTAGILPAYAGTEITATSSSVIETALKSSPLSVRSTVTVFLPSAPATRPDTFRVPPVGLNTISNTLIEAPSPTPGNASSRFHIQPEYTARGVPVLMHQAPQCTHPTLSASSFCINYGTDCIYLRDTAVFSRGTPSWPVQKTEYSAT